MKVREVFATFASLLVSGLDSSSVKGLKELWSSWRQFAFRSVGFVFNERRWGGGGDVSQVTCEGLFVPSKAISKKYACA
jgi:hypothetical protein